MASGGQRRAATWQAAMWTATCHCTAEDQGSSRVCGRYSRYGRYSRQHTGQQYGSIPQNAAEKAEQPGVSGKRGTEREKASSREKLRREREVLFLLPHVDHLMVHLKMLFKFDQSDDLKSLALS